MRSVKSILFCSIAVMQLWAAAAQAVVMNVSEVRISASSEGFLQVSELVALSVGSSVDVALAATATASDDGTTGGFWRSPDFAINGVAPADYPQIYHPDTESLSEFLLVTFNSPQDLEFLSIFGRDNDRFNVRDIYDVQLLDSAGNVLFSADGQSAVNAAREAVIDLNPVPVPAAAWLFGSALLGLMAQRRRR